ncbi:uncharacterized protein LOC125557334 [Nematostella vectensis]|uniref:uncharacterized protein LOC125557334 n=1 Tax=Nematostella vectensis TaxID=45351 RepID=UPI0020775F0B|nr:uncharacterized protein LOC125557334 [Nematostella vectensis]
MAQVENKSIFFNFQVLKVANARKWQPFMIGGEQYFAVASNSRNSDSPVFKWVDNQFVPFQTLQTKKAFDVEPIFNGKDVFLLLLWTLFTYLQVISVLNDRLCCSPVNLMFNLKVIGTQMISVLNDRVACP